MARTSSIGGNDGNGADLKTASHFSHRNSSAVHTLEVSMGHVERPGDSLSLVGRTPPREEACSHRYATQAEVTPMATCEVCGNEYDKAFSIVTPGDEKTHVFDSFECAIQALAPTCAHCGCSILGHGVESDAMMYC